jgi:hypothetical protein
MFILSLSRNVEVFLCIPIRMFNFKKYLIDNPMTKQEIRSQVIKKFRTLTLFSDKTGIPYVSVLCYFNTEQCDSEHKRITDLIETTEGVADDYLMIREKDRQAIRLCILTNFDSYSDFCRTEKGYDVVYVVNVVKGNLETETEKYRSLITLLTEYGLDRKIYKRIKPNIKPKDNVKRTNGASI